MRPQSITKLIALLLSMVLAIGCLTACSDAALEVGDEEVSYDLLRYFTMNYKNDLGYTDEEYAADPAKAKELEELVHTALQEVMAYRALMKKFDLELSDEDRESIQATIELMKSDYADDAEYQAAMEESYLTEAVYKELTEIRYCAEKLYEYLTSGRQEHIVWDSKTVDADLKKGNFFSAEYLYVYYSETDKDEKLAFANTLYEALESGKTMQELDDQYASEFGLSMEYVELGAFTFTQQAEDFEELIQTLKIGECSRPRVRGDGILIARRLAVSDEYVEEHYDEIVESYKEREFAFYIRAFGEDMKIEYQGDYKDLVLWKMK